jgi:hypothetical protein
VITSFGGRGAPVFTSFHVIVPEIVVAGLDSEGESLSVSKLELDGKE